MQISFPIVVNACWFWLVKAGPIVEIKNDLIRAELTSPMSLRARQTRPTPTPLSLIERQAFTPILHHASAAYCQPQSIAAWNCGTDCNEASPNFRPFRNGGGPAEGRFSPQWYVGYDPRNINPSGSNNGNGTIIVSHEGSGFSTAGLNAFSSLIPLDTSLIPGAPSGARVHQGYFGNFVKDATAVYDAVVGALDLYPNVRTVVVTGHSQGAALAAYTGVSLTLRPVLRSRNITVSVVAAAMPRTGNADWAAFVSRTVPYLRRINNVLDPIPITPPLVSGYSGLKGELHIQTSRGTWYNCSSEFDNPSSLCSVGATQPVFGFFNFEAIVLVIAIPANVGIGYYFNTYHNGPYNGVNMGRNCTPPATSLSIDGTLPLD